MVNPAPLLAAAATVDLTPPAGLPMGGYVLREGFSTGAHDPLEGTIVWVRDPSGGEIVWVVLDAVCVDEALASTIATRVAAAAGCRPEAVLVCATHTHSSAGGWFRSIGPFLRDKGDEALRETLVDQLARVAGTLPGQMEPVWPALAEGVAPDAGGNRNDPAGPHDSSVGALAFVNADGVVRAVVADFALHATVLGHSNRSWSADWPGATRRVVADALSELAPFGEPDDAPGRPGRPPVVTVLQGAAGDASPRFARRAQTYAEVDRLGGLVGAAAVEAILRARTEDGPVSVAVRSHVISVPTRHLPSSDDADRLAADTERAWQDARRRGASAPEERIARTRYEGAMVLGTLVKAGLPPAVEMRISVASIGDAAWVHLPVELFASYGLAIRDASPFAWTRVVGYTGDYQGYVADADAQDRGVYEAYASQFDASGGQALAEAAISLLREATPARAGQAETVR